MSKPVLLGFAQATESLSGPAAAAVFRHCVNVLRPKSGGEGENLQSVHTEAVSLGVQACCSLSVVTFAQALLRGGASQDFVFRSRLSACLKEDGLYKDAAHALAGHRRFDLRLQLQGWLLLLLGVTALVVYLQRA